MNVRELMYALGNVPDEETDVELFVTFDSIHEVRQQIDRVTFQLKRGAVDLSQGQPGDADPIVIIEGKPRF